MIHLRIEPPGGPPVDATLESAEVLIGRSPSAGLMLADLSVSRQHARLLNHGGIWQIAALSETNPTFLNDRRVTTPVELRSGDVMRFGQTIVRVLDETARAVPVAPPVAPPSDDRQAARLRILNDIHRALAAPISLADLLSLILERCFEVLNPEEGVVMLRSPAGEFVRAASRKRVGLTGDVVVSRRVVDEVAAKGRSVLVLDAAVDERFSASESLMMSGVRGVLAAPLTDAEGTMGMIALVSRLSVRPFTQQDLDMLESLAAAAALRVRNVALAEEAAARKVLQRELALAHDMQMSMLPRRMPERPEVDVAAALEPARSVGGDLYDFVLDGDRLWFIVGDVAGKGVGAALYMAVAKTLFRASIQGTDELADVVRRINRQLCADNEQVIFVTAVIGHLALSTGEVALTDAGHNPALRLTGAGGLVDADIPKCMALGVLEGTDYEAGHFALSPGETLILYTDGATDARNPGGDLFGDGRLRASIGARAGRVPADVIAGVVADIDAFAAGAPPEDDVTLLAVMYRGA